MAKHCAALDQQFLQNLADRQLAVDFTPALGKRILTVRGGPSIATIAVVCSVDNLILGVYDLERQESYKLLQPDLKRLSERVTFLTGKKLLPCCSWPIFAHSMMLYHDYRT